MARPISLLMLLSLTYATAPTLLPESADNASGSIQNFYIDEWSPITQVDSDAPHHPVGLFVYGASNLINVVKNTASEIRVVHFAEQSAHPAIHDLPLRLYIIYEITQRTGSFYLGIVATVSYQVFGIDIEKMVYLSDLNLVMQVLEVKPIEADFSSSYPDLLLQIKSSEKFDNIQRNIPIFQEDLHDSKSLETQQQQPALLSQIPADSSLYPSKLLVSALAKSTNLLRTASDIKVLHIAVDNMNLLTSGDLCSVECLFQTGSSSESVFVHVKAQFTALPSESLVIQEVHLYSGLEAVLQKTGIKLKTGFPEFYPELLTKFMSDPFRLQLFSCLSDSSPAQN